MNVRTGFGSTVVAGVGIDWTPLRRELYDWLDARSPVLGDAYHAALMLLSGPSFRGRDRLICHTLRDIANELPFTIEGNSKSTPTQYANAIDRCIPGWPARSAVSTPGKHAPAASEDVLIPRSAYAAIDGLVEERKRIKKGGARKSTALFLGLMKEFGGTGTVSTRVLKEYRELFDWFTKWAHFRKSQSDRLTEEGLKAKVASFERVLHCFVGDFFAVKDELDSVLASANAIPFQIPDDSAVRGLLLLLSHPQHEMYFFEHLQNPHWVEPLNRRGALLPGDPPAAASNDEAPTYAYAPGAKYAARMSTFSPPAVCDVFVATGTRNPWIQRFLVDAAAALPEPEVVRLVPRLAGIVAEGGSLLNYGRVCNICAMLAKGHSSSEAMELARSLFGPGRAESDDIEHREYRYMEGLAEALPALVACRAQEFLELICEHLEVVIRARGFGIGDGEYDGSYSWRPAIEEHPDNEIHSFEGRLVGKLREGFELAIGSQALLLAEALEILRGYKLAVFERLGIHLVNHFAERDEGLARAIMMEERFLDDYWYEHE